MVFETKTWNSGQHSSLFQQKNAVASILVHVNCNSWRSCIVFSIGKEIRYGRCVNTFWYPDERSMREKYQEKQRYGLARIQYDKRWDQSLILL